MTKDVRQMTTTCDNDSLMKEVMLSLFVIAVMVMVNGHGKKIPKSNRFVV